MNFAGGVVTPVNSSAMSSFEGSASISDELGNLLFYTNGEKVWNAANLVIANGAALNGNQSSAQSSLIVPKKGAAYYLFTTGAGGSGSFFSYSVVDMSLASGLGSVTVLNHTLVADVPERLAGTRHCNGIDTWVVTQKTGTNQFYAFQVSSSGVSPSPVISSVGPVSSYSAYIGAMKFSANGDKLAVVMTTTSGSVDIYDFNRSTGTLSLTLSLPVELPYGCEFSRDGSKLYVSSWNASHRAIVQWDLCGVTLSNVLASEYTVTANPSIQYSALQLAPDGRILIAIPSQTAFLPCISNPGSAGVLCNYQTNAVSIGTGTSSNGLPNFVSSLMRELPGMSVTTQSCGITSFSVQSPGYCSAVTNSILAYKWFFGAQNSNSSSLSSPSHTFLSNGIFSVQVVLGYADCVSDTIASTVTVSALPPLTISANHTLCAREAHTFTLSGATSYSLNGTSVSRTVAVNPSVTSVYTAAGTGTNGCKAETSATLTVKPCTDLTEPSAMPVRVFPNPSAGLFTIGPVETGKLIRITEISGKEVFRVVVTDPLQTIDLSELTPGLYILDIPSGHVILIRE